jgi:nitrile hydratase accessory protein
MSRPGARADRHDVGTRIAELASAAEAPPLPADGDGPVFQEPWQATAFALAVHLSERGAIPWTEWSAALGREIQAAANDPTRADAYYRHWLRALERICAEKGMIEPAEINCRQDEWHRAYLATPHGQPVQLNAPHHDEAKTPD